MAELRVVVAMILYNFDLELDGKSADRYKGGGRFYVMWDKKPLYLKLSPVEKTRQRLDGAA